MRIESPRRHAAAEQSAGRPARPGPGRCRGAPAAGGRRVSLNLKMASEQHVKVVLRSRPMSATEKAKERPVLQCIGEKMVEVGYNSSGKLTKKQFCFDGVFDDKTTQKEFYDRAVSNVVDEVLQV